MAQHFFTGPFAFSAFLGALFHLGIVWISFAFLPASSTGFRTDFAYQVGERPLPRNDAGSRRTMIGAIQTSLQGFAMLLFSLRCQGGTMHGTIIANPLTVVTLDCTLFKVGSVLVLVAFLSDLCAPQTGRGTRHYDE
jgi:hypothetical protein